jgi:hypothetical protein
LSERTPGAECELHDRSRISLTLNPGYGVAKTRAQTRRENKNYYGNKIASILFSERRLSAGKQGEGIQNVAALQTCFKASLRCTHVDVPSRRRHIKKWNERSCGRIVARAVIAAVGGTGGTAAKPTPEQVAVEKEHHVAPTAEQTRHVEAAAKDPALSLNSNHGHPTVAATAHPALFKGPVIIAAHPGKPIAAVAPEGHRKAATGNSAAVPGKVGPGNAARRRNPRPQG